MSSLHAGLEVSGFEVLGLGEDGEEATYEGVSGSVGVDEELLVELLDLVLGNLSEVGNDGGVGSLGEDDGAGARAVVLGGGGDGESNLRGMDVGEVC